MATTISSATNSSGGLASPGLGSGLDINSLVGKLMAVEQQPLGALARREASYQARLTAFGSVKGAVAAFQGAMQTLSSATAFKAMNAAVSDSSVLSASAGSDAAPGRYALSVDHLAQAQVLASSGLADPNTASSPGTLAIQVGSGSSRTITLDAGNDTLSGLRDAINAAGAGVTASIVNVGGATPYKLVLSADATGADNTISITNNLAAGALHDTVDSLTEVRAASDAAFSVNGVDVTSATNTNATAIPGLTLTLLKGGDSSITVTRDTGGVQSAVSGFVKAYNDLNGVLAGLTAYNASTRQGGALLGDAAVQQLQASLRTIVGGTATGTGGSLTMLSQVGVAFQKDGALTLDPARLAGAIDSRFGELGSLFGTLGRSTNPLLAFAGSSAKTTAGSYDVTITAAATQAAISAGSAPAATTVIDASNDQLALNVDGTAGGSVTLAHGSYTASQLAQAVQSALNGAAAFTDAGRAVDVTVSGGKLVITSRAFGSASSVGGATGSALGALGFAGSEAATGSDVAGRFVIDGQTITGSGSGQRLSAPAGSAAEGLAVLYTGTPAQQASTPGATLNLSDGIASKLARLAAGALEDKGALASRSDGLNALIADVGARREALTARLAAVEANYRKQFNALDGLLSNLNRTSSFLTQQLDILSNWNSSKK